jgi:hypothetical protein
MSKINELHMFALAVGGVMDSAVCTPTKPVDAGVNPLDNGGVMPSPLRGSLSSAVDGYHPVGVRVVGLFKLRRPSHITNFVVTIAVNAINRVGFAWPLSNVRNELCETVEPELYSATSVSTVPISSGPLATVFGRIVNQVFGRLASAVRFRIGTFERFAFHSGGGTLCSKTAATHGQTTGETSGVHICFCAAGASANPVPSPADTFALLGNGPSVELHSGKILRILLVGAPATAANSSTQRTAVNCSNRSAIAANAPHGVSLHNLNEGHDCQSAKTLVCHVNESWMVATNFSRYCAFSHSKLLHSFVVRGSKAFAAFSALAFYTICPPNVESL